MAWVPRVRRDGHWWEWEVTECLLSFRGDALTRAGAVRAARRRAAEMNRPAGPWEDS